MRKYQPLFLQCAQKNEKISKHNQLLTHCVLFKNGMRQLTAGCNTYLLENLPLLKIFLITLNQYYKNLE